MVKIDLAAPVLLRVAIVACGMKIPAVRTGRAMAGAAFRTQLLGGRVSGVADVAIELGMDANQRKLGLCQMIVFDRVPDLVAMAIVALGAKAACVGIIGLVAAVAVLGNLGFVVTAPVATQAVDLVVKAK